MAIIAGLNNAAVFRLKWTREGVPREGQQVTQFNIQFKSIYLATIYLAISCIFSVLFNVDEVLADYHF